MSEHRADGREYTETVPTQNLLPLAASCAEYERSPKMALDESLLLSLRALLDAESGKPRQIEYCPDCGFLMEHRTFTFALASSSDKWQITFPFCPECNPTVRH